MSAYQNFNLYWMKYVPCGLVARIRRSHRRGRGSIPRTGDSKFASPAECSGLVLPPNCKSTRVDAFPHIKVRDLADSFIV